MMTTTPQTAHKRKLLAAIHAEKKRFALDDDTYRSILHRISGKESSKDLDVRQLGAVLSAVRGQPASTRRHSGYDDPHVRKARALWLSLHALGVVRDPSDRALTSFARRQLKIDALPWVGPKAARLLIEPLRDMCARAGYVVPSNVQADAAMRLLIQAQAAMLYPDGVPDPVRSWIANTPAYDVAEALGQRIRQAQCQQCQ